MNAPIEHVLLSMPPQEISTEVLIEKYAKDGETSIGEIHRREARALAAVERPEKQAEVEALFMWALERGLVPAGRIASAAGTSLQATLINCFVQPVGDSVSDFANGKPSIYQALAEAAETMRRGGGVGYDFSQIRPENALVRATRSRASGPLSFIPVFDKSCETVESAGARRGAQMGVLRVDHPDIFKFIRAKDTGDFKNFNLSIGVTDAFMRAVEDDVEIELVHRAEPHPDYLAKSSAGQDGGPEWGGAVYQRADGMWVYRKVRARDLWEEVMHSTYDHAEPGILFLDRMNEENNLWYCETIEATNPCAEQPLPDYGCCDLGSTNLTSFVRAPFTDGAFFDFDRFAKVCRVGVRLLDNVLDATYWPLPQQKAEAESKRRIGLGFLGLGSALVMLGLRYDSDEGRAMASKISEVLRDESYLASVDLAIEKGPFPLFDADKYLASGFAKRLPERIRALIRTHGLRNSHLLSIAPTGTITLAFADNASNGIEPAFSWVYDRKKRMADGSAKMYELADHAWRLYRHLGHDMGKLPSQFVTALKMSADDHMLMLKVVQPFIDTSISKTVNVPADYPYDEFKDLYLNGWKAGLKGLATYRPNSVLGSVLSEKPSTAASDVAAAPAPVASAFHDDPLTKQFAKRPEGELQSATSKVEFWANGNKHSLYVGVSFMPVDGILDAAPVTIERPVEFFLMGSQGDAGQQWIDVSLRLLSMTARSGLSVAKAIENMREITWDKGTVRSGYISKADGSKAPRFHESVVAAVGFELQEILTRRGFFDAMGKQVPVRELASRFARRLGLAGAAELSAAPQPAEASEVSVHFASGTGAKCPECGGHDLHHIDGCTRCVNCGYVGACG